MKFLIILLFSIIIDGSKEPIKKSFITNPAINYPGFPNDTLQIDSIKFCTILKEGSNCDNNEMQKIIFVFDPIDSIMTEYSDDLSHILINRYQIEKIEIDSISKIKFCRYLMRSQLKEYKDNVYVFEKFYYIDFMKMYAITPSEIYYVCFFHS